MLRFETRAARLAALLADAVEGRLKRRNHRRRQYLRLLRARIERHAARRLEASEVWHDFEEAPRREVDRLAGMLSDLLADDVVARRYAELLIPRDPPRPSEIEYRDFAVAFEETSPEGEEGILRASLVDSPVGKSPCQAVIDLRSVLESAHLPRAPASSEAGVLRDATRRRVVVPEAERSGVKLFESLFVEDLRDAWSACRGYLAGRPRLGLRLRLLFDLESETVRAVAAWPWELLEDPSRRPALSKDRRTPVVRSLPSAGPPFTASQRRERVLIVRSAPIDQPQLDLDSEVQEIVEAWHSRPAVQILDLEADLEALRHRIADHSFSVLHFMGHGEIHGPTREGRLFFESAGRRARAVPASALVEQLAGPDLELVVLSACQSGTADRRAWDPYSGVAASFLHAGVPAVLAMREPVSDPAAITFVRELYRHLAVGSPLEVAVTEGRLAISRSPEIADEWDIPVLWTRR